MKLRPSRQLRVDVSGYLFVLPQLLGLVLFVLAPLVLVVVYSFQDFNVLSGQADFTGVDNYRQLLTDPNMSSVLRATAVFSGVLVVFNIIVGLLLAVLLNQRFAGTTLFRVLFFSPVVVSTVAWTLVWDFLLQDNGGVNALLQMAGMNGTNWLRSPSTAMAAVIAVQLLKGVGLNMVLFLSALQGVPKDFHEAASLDGAGPIRRLVSITMPLISPTTLLVAILSFISALQSFALISVLTQGGPGRSTTVLVYYLFQQAFQSHDFGYGSALALLLFAIVLSLSLVQWQLRKKWVTYDV